MKLHHRNDTIAAIATPAGEGGISVLRISGTESFSIADKIFHGKQTVAKTQSHTLLVGKILDHASSDVDDVVVSVFRSPHSYTGEDVAEISCHGGYFLTQKILSLIIDAGARQARPGEFTLRGFLNRKFDLSQAEAVADLISAHSQSSHDLAIKQMRGGFSKKITALRQLLLDFTSLIELELDFSEEHMIFADRTDLNDLLSQLEAEVSQLVSSFSLGNVVKQGIPVAIVGKPNVGKSTLLNAILNEEKAIVSEIPGTTRDAIEDTIVIGGYSFRFIDTAGLRAAEDQIETIGIERTWEKINDASIILYVFDVTEQSFPDVMESISEFTEPLKQRNQRLILIGNKTDKLDELPKGFKDFVDYQTIFVSGKRKENIHLIADHLQQVVAVKD